MIKNKYKKYYKEKSELYEIHKAKRRTNNSFKNLNLKKNKDKLYEITINGKTYINKNKNELIKDIEVIENAK